MKKKKNLRQNRRCLNPLGCLYPMAHQCPSLIYLAREKLFLKSIPNSLSFLLFPSIFLKCREQNYFLIPYKKNTPHQLLFTFPFINKILFFYFYFNFLFIYFILSLSLSLSRPLHHTYANFQASFPP
jgi:hypothetical protein